MQYYVKQNGWFLFKIKLKNNSIDKKEIEKEIKNHKSELDILSQKLVKKGIAEISPAEESPYIFLHGQSSLLNNDIIKGDLDKIKFLFEKNCSVRDQTICERPLPCKNTIVSLSESMPCPASDA